jgi:hypothetical protein
MDDRYLILRKNRYIDYNQPTYYPGNTNPYKNLIQAGKKIIIEKELEGEITFIGFGEVDRIEEIPPLNGDHNYTTSVHFKNYMPFFPPRIKSKEIRKRLLRQPYYNWYGSIRPISEEIFSEIIDFCSNPNWSLFLNEASYSDEQISKSVYDLLRENESKYLEFKSSMIHLTQKTESHQESESIKSKIQKEIFLTIAAFSNTKGGTIIIGVDDRGAVLGIEEDYAELSRKKDWGGWQEKFRDLFRKYFDDKLLIQNIDPIPFPINGKTVVRIDVPKSSGPVFINKDGNSNETEFYIRTFTSSEKLDGKYIYGFIDSKDEWKK